MADGDTKEMIHAAVDPDIARNVELIAIGENRSKSNTIETLLREALAARLKGKHDAR